MRYAIFLNGESRSFPDTDPLHAGETHIERAEVVLYSGVPFKEDVAKALILIELGDESLAEHVGEEGIPNVLGFVRYRNGDDAPSNLVELVKQAAHGEKIISIARKFFQFRELQVSVSSDQIGRIINRLVLAKYNAALRFIDEGLATQQDMDNTCKLGLGYPDGPIERVIRGGLKHHYARTQALFETYGTPAYAPPRRAIAAARFPRRNEKADK
ncbi:3-hydroxyacyl-CoA dehydrogenase family protein [Bradyrhizobium sp. AZCC 2289]|uniref:3-hydroxyacyl-CoA dehydrogenase family protein n=1 Tax=Bradyrhizobium sp. AZCC 2289 TaxID=3117026 RepID=UPI002FF26AF4